MAVKPTTVPRWASNDIIDPTSGVNNVIEPSEAKKDLGHGPKGEFAPRQYQNWFMRWVYRWLKLVDERHAQFFVVTGITDGSTFSIPFASIDPELTPANTTVVNAYFNDGALPPNRWKPGWKLLSGIWTSTTDTPPISIVINGAATSGWPFRIILMKINYSVDLYP